MIQTFKDFLIERKGNNLHLYYRTPNNTNLPNKTFNDIKQEFKNKSGKEIRDIITKYKLNIYDFFTDAEIEKLSLIDRQYLKYHILSIPHEGKKSATYRGKYGFIDDNGKVIIPFKYDRIITDFTNNRAIVKKGNDYIIIDETGKEISTTPYNYVGDFYEGFAKVQIGNNYGLIDETGNIFIKPIYDYIGEFHDDFVKVQLGNYWGFINKNKKLIAPFKYDSVWNFKNGKAKIKLNNRIGFIDETGKEYWSENT